MKRWILFVALFATTALWAYDFKSGDLYYNKTNNGTVAVTYQKDNSSDNYSGLTSAVIPESVTYNGTTYRVTSIEEFAFRYCSGLTSVTIPNSIKSIRESAFRGCTSLTSVVWNAKSYEDFGNSMYAPFSAICSQITSFTFGDEVEHIPTYLCYKMAGLTSITIPNSVTSIGGCAFSDCSSLTSVTIPNSVTSIGNYAFYDCFGLTSITIPNSVTSIGSSAFEGCSNLETVIFGSGLLNIGDNAFHGCQNIYEMTVYATQVPNVVAEKEGSTYYGTFRGVSKLAELHVPAESVKKYKIHPVWGLFNVITAIPYTVTLLCDNVQGAVVGSGSYQPNEQVTITAKANAGYRFVQWSDGITTNPRTIVVVSDTTLTAEFEEIPTSEYTVSVVVDPAQHGAVQMTLTAVPDAGYQFAHWSDGNTENPRTILIKENMTLSATFNLSTKANNASAEDFQDGIRKVFRNGQVYIIHGEKTYTATGAQL